MDASFLALININFVRWFGLPPLEELFDVERDFAYPCASLETV